MKKINVLLLVVLISVISSLRLVTAQEQTKTDQEKELQILKSIEEQKKAMTEQKKAQEEALQIIKEKQIELDENLQNIRVEVETDGEAGKSYKIFNKRGARSFDFAEPYIVSPGVEAPYGHSMGGDSERTTWEFSRSVKEKTFSRDYSFDVEKTVNTVVMSVMGDCKAGEIRIKIQMPNGKNYSDIVLDEFGNLNWRKSFTISETENQDKAGEWKFKIDSSKATGFFKISLQTF
jgi:hypothetical protein